MKHLDEPTAIHDSDDQKARATSPDKGEDDRLATLLDTKGAWPVRPLTRTRRDNGLLYTREAAVETQVQALSHLPTKQRRERLLMTGLGWHDTQRLREETLVYFAREFAAYGDEATAWRIVEVLIERTAAHVQRKLSRWRLTPDDTDDCVRDLYAALCDALFDRSVTAEFWEVRFWVCLDRRLWNLVEKRQAVADSEVGPGDLTQTEDNDSGLDALFGRIADTGPSPEALTEYKEALSLLNENERTALYLVYIEGLPEESEDPNRLSAAKVLGVTGRSVRNYLRKAKEKLLVWKRGTMQA